MSELPAEVEEALEWLTKVHDSDPSARRLAILRAALNAADAQRAEAVSFAEHWRSAAARTAVANRDPAPQLCPECLGLGGWPCGTAMPHYLTDENGACEEA